MEDRLRDRRSMRMRRSNIHLIRNPKERAEKQSVFEEITAENSPELMKDKMLRF